MHGNTVNGIQRVIKRACWWIILNERIQSSSGSSAEGSYAAVDFEMIGQNVTDVCGAFEVDWADSADRNILIGTLVECWQSLELAFMISETLKKARS